MGNYLIVPNPKLIIKSYLIFWIFRSFESR